MFADKIGHFNGATGEATEKNEDGPTSETTEEQGGGDAAPAAVETTQESATPMES